MQNNIFICPKCRKSLIIENGVCASCGILLCERTKHGSLFIHGDTFLDHDHIKVQEAWESGNYAYY